MFRSKDDTIFRRLIERLNLQILARDPVVVPHTIQPTIDINDLLKDVEHRAAAITITGTGNTTLVTIPDDEKWTILAMDVYLTSGTWTMNAIIVKSGTYSLVMKKDAGSVTNLQYYPSDNVFVVAGGEDLQISVDGHTVNGDCGAKIRYLKENKYK